MEVLAPGSCQGRHLVEKVASLVAEAFGLEALLQEVDKFYMDSNPLEEADTSLVEA